MIILKSFLVKYILSSYLGLNILKLIPPLIPPIYVPESQKKVLRISDVLLFSLIHHLLYGTCHGTGPIV